MPIGPNFIASDDSMMQYTYFPRVDPVSTSGSRTATAVLAIPRSGFRGAFGATDLPVSPLRRVSVRLPAVSFARARADLSDLGGGGAPRAARRSLPVGFRIFPAPAR